MRQRGVEEEKRSGGVGKGHGEQAVERKIESVRRSGGGRTQVFEEE